MKKHDASEPPVEPAEQTARPDALSAAQEDSPLATLQQENGELVEHLQRLQAEFDNFRKRMAREQEEMKAAANDRVLKELLPVVDNLQLSVQHAKGADGAIKGEDLLSGIIMINEQLKGLLEHHGLAEIPDGGRFDPRLHEALTMVHQEGADRGTVLQTYQRGYLRDGRVFRPAKVSVAK